MNILFATSEVTPFAKTGGLADVCSALPIALSQLGHHVSVIMPSYFQAETAGFPIKSTGLQLEVPIGNERKLGELLYSKLPNSDVPIYFVKHDYYYHRDGLYNSHGVDYLDNSERFIFFCRSVLEAIRLLNLDLDILHANDWQTGILFPLLEILYKTKSPFQDRVPNSLLLPSQLELYDKIGTVLTIHNMRHQGRFGQGDMALTGLDWSYFTYDMLEFYGQLNFLKSGIIFADAITTVSPKYAEEIQTEGFGETLQGVLRFRQDSLTGILNGIDTDEWNPATDPFIAVPFDQKTVFENKPKCKQALQRETGLPEVPDTPLFGVVSRFDIQKGLDLVADVIPYWVERYGVQFVILGTGDSTLEQRFRKLAERYPNNVRVLLTFSPALSHQIEAGIDMFLMPSRYEPCGLNQMYSHRYGSLPIVRVTGGLADTITNAYNETMANRTANGFTFYWGTTEDINKAIDWAVHCYFERKEDWKQMILTAMNQDWSWNRSARKYLDVYQNLLKKK